MFVLFVNIQGNKKYMNSYCLWSGLHIEVSWLSQQGEHVGLNVAFYVYVQAHMKSFDTWEAMCDDQICASRC